MSARPEAYVHRMENALRDVAETASAWCWDGTPESETALRDAVAEWRTTLGLRRLAEQRLTVPEDSA